MHKADVQQQTPAKPTQVVYLAFLLLVQLRAQTAMQAPECDSSVAVKLPLGTALRAPGNLIRAAISGDLMCFVAAHRAACSTVDA